MHTQRISWFLYEELTQTSDQEDKNYYQILGVYVHLVSDRISEGMEWEIIIMISYLFRFQVYWNLPQARSVPEERRKGRIHWAEPITEL